MSNPGLQPQADSFLVYMNLAQGIRMRYPSTWEKRDETGASGFVVIFLSPQEDPFDQFRENVNLFIEVLPQPMSLEQVARSNRELILQQMPVTFELEPVKDQLAGLPAYRVIYTGPLGELAGKWMQYYAIKNGKAYTLTYTAEQAKFDLFLPPAKQIASSLEIK